MFLHVLLAGSFGKDKNVQILDKTHSSRYPAQAKQLHELRKPSSNFSLSIPPIKYQNCLIHNLKVKYFQNIKLEDFMDSCLKQHFS